MHHEINLPAESVKRGAAIEAGWSAHRDNIERFLDLSGHDGVERVLSGNAIALWIATGKGAADAFLDRERYTAGESRIIAREAVRMFDRTGLCAFN